MCGWQECFISGSFNCCPKSRIQLQHSLESDYLHYRVPGEIKRRGVELDPQVSPEEIMSREVELGCDFFRFGLFLNSSQQCNGNCPCDSAQHGS